MIKGSKIIEVPISHEMRVEAWRKSEEMGKLKNSILQGMGNETGFLGEEVLKKYAGDKVKLEGDNTYNYDIILNGKKVDVKSKLTAVKPKSDYDCSVAAYNTSQLCDLYIFVRIHDLLESGWILGYLPKEEYYKKARFLKKGEIDPTNNFTVKADCYNVKIYDLMDIKDLINEQKE